MARKYYRPMLNKWELESLIHISSKIIRIEMQNQEINNKLKTVFFCESEKEPKGRMCIVWEDRTTFEVGDFIEMQGRLANGVFLVKTFHFKRKEGN